MSLNVSFNDDHQMLKYQSLLRPIYVMMSTFYVILINIRIGKHKLIDLIADISVFDDGH